MKITILGSGTSQGVPVIACNCKVCKSLDSKDKRLRSSILLQFENDKNYVVDTGPDFRQQLLRENVQNLEAALFTHAHKDHIAGLDDIRAFNFKQEKDMLLYCNSDVEEALRREFYYAFQEYKYPGVPKLELQQISKTSSFKLTNGVEVTPIEVLHYKMPVLGFRINDFAYITDAKTVVQKEKAKLKGLDTLIVNALRKEEHLSHFNLEQALEFIEELQPKQAYLTHISHLFGKHENIEKELPENVSVAYDGMQIEC